MRLGGGGGEGGRCSHAGPPGGRHAVLLLLARLPAPTAHPQTHPPARVQATVFFHPAQWQRAAGDLRGRLGTGSGGGGGQLSVGLGLNNAKLCGALSASAGGGGVCARCGREGRGSTGRSAQHEHECAAGGSPWTCSLLVPPAHLPLPPTIPLASPPPSRLYPGAHRGPPSVPRPVSSSL